MRSSAGSSIEPRRTDAPPCGSSGPLTSVPLRGRATHAPAPPRMSGVPRRDLPGFGRDFIVSVPDQRAATTPTPSPSGAGSGSFRGLTPFVQECTIFPWQDAEKDPSARRRPPLRNAEWEGRYAAASAPTPKLARLWRDGSFSAASRVAQAAQKGPDARRRATDRVRRTPRTPQRARERANAADGSFSAA
jgi:hypothetical protein